MMKPTAPLSGVTVLELGTGIAASLTAVLPPGRPQDDIRQSVFNMPAPEDGMRSLSDFSDVLHSNGFSVVPVNLKELRAKKGGNFLVVTPCHGTNHCMAINTAAESSEAVLHDDRRTYEFNCTTLWELIDNTAERQDLQLFRVQGIDEPSNGCDLAFYPGDSHSKASNLGLAFYPRDFKAAARGTKKAAGTKRSSSDVPVASFFIVCVVVW